MGEEVRIKFPALTWAVYNCKFCEYRGKAERAGEEPELGTKCQAELRTRAGDCSRWLYSSRGGECLNPFFFFFIILFIYLLFLAALGLCCCTGFFSSCGKRGLLSSRGAQASHGGFPCCGAQALEHWLSSSGTRARLLLGMWDPPGPGIEPKSPTMAGRFPSTEPPGKP